jgi:hypothetical protein
LGHHELSNRFPFFSHTSSYPIEAFNTYGYILELKVATFQLTAANVQWKADFNSRIAVVALKV